LWRGIKRVKKTNDTSLKKTKKKLRADIDLAESLFVMSDERKANGTYWQMGKIKEIVHDKYLNGTTDSNHYAYNF